MLLQRFVDTESEGQAGIVQRSRPTECNELLDPPNNSDAVGVEQSSVVLGTVASIKLLRKGCKA